jgi:hypothetical protein
MTKETGGPAFPSMRDMRHNPDFDHEEGITTRDYFAAKALQGWLATYPSDVDCHMVGKTAIAKFSYDMADAMLKAREA